MLFNSGTGVTLTLQQLVGMASSFGGGFSMSSSMGNGLAAVTREERTSLLSIIMDVGGGAWWNTVVVHFFIFTPLPFVSYCLTTTSA